MTSSIVTLLDERTGEETEYRRVSARLPGFLERYPPDDGYGVTTEWRDSLALQAGRLELMRGAIAAGKPPADMGLAIDGVPTMICIKRLTDPDGRVLAEGNAAKTIREYKDVECLETAALQRLLAALGFGGQVFDDDENGDFAAQGLTADAQPAEVARGAQPSDNAQTADTPTVDATPQAPAADSCRESGAKGIPAAMRKQVENLAHRLDEAVPAMDSLEDAKKALKQLAAKDRERHAAHKRAS